MGSTGIHTLLNMRHVLDVREWVGQLPSEVPALDPSLQAFAQERAPLLRRQIAKLSGGRFKEKNISKEDVRSEYDTLFFVRGISDVCRSS